MGVDEGVFVGVGVGVRVLVGVNVGVSVGVGVRVLVGVIVGVPVGVSDKVAVKRLVFVALGVTRMIITDLETVPVAVTVGCKVLAVKGIIAGGAGTRIRPMIPIKIKAIPLAELIIKSLGYFIRFKKSFNHTIHQFTIQIKIIIGSFSMVRTNHNFICLMS